MPLTDDTIIWTGKQVGVTIECYNDKFSIKAVRKFVSQGEQKIGYDWSFGQEYDQTTKKWKPREKASPTSVYLGEKSEAIDALKSLLAMIGYHQPAYSPKPDDEPPF